MIKIAAIAVNEHSGNFFAMLAFQIAWFMTMSISGSFAKIFPAIIIVVYHLAFIFDIIFSEIR